MLMKRGNGPVLARLPWVKMYKPGDANSKVVDIPASGWGLSLFFKEVS